MIYLQAEEGQATEMFKYDRQEYKLQVNDILDVQIRSMNPEINNLFSTVPASFQSIQQSLSYWMPYHHSVNYDLY